MTRGDQPKSTRGFASMDPEKRREIARIGGRSVPKEKRSFSKDRTLAREAGRKGGMATQPEMRSFTNDKDVKVSGGQFGGTASKAKADSPG